MLTLQDVQTTVLDKCRTNEDMAVSIGDLVSGYRGGSTFETERGQFRFNHNALNDLVTKRIGAPVGGLTFLDGAPDLQYQVLAAYVAKAGCADTRVNLRATGDTVDHVLSSDYVTITNTDVVFMLQQMIAEKHLPEGIQFHRFGLAKSGRSMYARIVAPDDWNFNLGVNKKRDPAYGGLYISNDETGGGAFSTGALLARVSCFNTTVGKSAISVDHRWATIQDFYNALVQAVTHIVTYADEMAVQMRTWRQHELENPLTVFEKVGHQLKLPGYSMVAAREYWEEQTSRLTLFDVIQAITWGTKLMSESRGKRSPVWSAALNAESNVYEVVNQIHVDGEAEFVSTAGDWVARLSEADSGTEVIANVRPHIQQLDDREVIVLS